MDRRAFRLKMESNMPKRKKNRLENFDYGAGYSYFITICTNNRERILSSIVGEGSSLPQLTRSGEIIKSLIENVPTKYSNFSVDYYVIMPNHIHLLITVHNDGRENPSPTVSSFVGWFKYQATKQINDLMDKKGTKLFQRSYYDHVIRNRSDYDQVSKYIWENPINWENDELYKEG